MFTCTWTWAWEDIFISLLIWGATWYKKNHNFNFWFTAANFLGYGNNLQVVRVVDETTSKNSGTAAGILIKNEDDYESKSSSDLAAAGFYAGRYAGELGNSLLVSQSDNTKVSLPEFGAVSNGIATTANGRAGSIGLNTTSFGFIINKNLKKLLPHLL